MNKTILAALTESLILESYKDVKTRFINDGANKDEVTKLLDLHKKLKDMKRLKDNEVNIDALVKGKSFDEFKALMSRYSEKDTETKTDKWAALKKKIVAENNEWTVYKIDTPEEAYLFHGLVKWCIASGTKSAAAGYFMKYSKFSSIFFAIVRKNPVGDKFDYIMDQYNWEKRRHIYWDAEDVDHDSLKTGDLSSLNIPSYRNEILKINAAGESNMKNLALNVLKSNDDGTYSCDAPLDHTMLKHVIENGKFTIKFKYVTSDFNCRGCGLTSLEGCPEKVGGDFDCSDNKLTSLEGAPKEVGRDFNCYYNELTSLEGAPQKVGEDFNCSENKLTSLKGAPKEVKGAFKCDHNNLTTLEGGPQKAGWWFKCDHNKLTTLKGAPEEVGGSFSCGHNKLTTLKGGPQKVNTSFECAFNKLTSLEGMPKGVSVDFYCNNNNLNSLKGAPEELRDNFACSNNNLTTLEGCPKKVGGSFYCSNNKLTTLEGGPEEVGRYFECDHNKLKSLKGAPKEVDGNFICNYNKDLKSLDGIGKVKGHIISDI